MGLLFVVAREEEHLYDSLVQAFAGRPGVRVVLDRRGGGSAGRRAPSLAGSGGSATAVSGPTPAAS